MNQGYSTAAPDSPTTLLPLAAIHVLRTTALWAAAGGEPETLSRDEAARRIDAAPPLLCHAPSIARRLDRDHLAGYDILELFAFVRPAQFTLPTLHGVARTLGIAADQSVAPIPLLHAVAGRLLAEIAADNDERDDAVAIARDMARAGWLWGPIVLKALGAEPSSDAAKAGTSSALAVWRKLPEWAEMAPETQPGNDPVEPAEARQRLAELLGDDAEPRPMQADYASAVSAMFAPRSAPDTPNFVLAEAGTGTGKTLGYIAPASLWAERNGGPVWISTYTRNLQRQIDQELDHLYPDPQLKAAKVVIRKGRENYLCLLNMEEAVGRFATLRPREAVGLGLLARWAAATRDGDFGGDFPAWLVDLVGTATTLSLSDRRGECIYSSCLHYSKCYIEHSVRRARRADLVIANHALVMIQAALGDDDDRLPTRYVFDEGHHLFDAADSAFGGRLSGQETAELRRWLLGPEGGRRRPGGRTRGLRERAGDLIAADDSVAQDALSAALAAAGALPAPGWMARLSESNPDGPAETFLSALRQQVYARASTQHSYYSLECEVHPLDHVAGEAAHALADALAQLVRPLLKLRDRLRRRLDVDADELDSATRTRIEAVCRGLARRGEILVSGWVDMLGALDAETPEVFVDWFAVDRTDGRDFDAGMFRHWVDPTVPFAESVARRAHGVLVTSATLTGRSGDVEEDWRTAERRTGAVHLPAPAIRSRVASPFDYAEQTRVIIVTDVQRNEPDQVAAALRELFLAAGGGGLGLFTSIARLRQVYARIDAPLEDAGLPLYAQHVDALNVATLIDIFRAEADACLLGTDAVRDGVDVPGASLRLLVFDRVPWPRPTILHKARREEFGGRAYDDMHARLRLSQAYGRLIRRDTDRGVFVVLDSAMPSRLLGAFPEGVEAQRIGLVDAIEETTAFLGG
ncbi:MAG: ATP-dependent DNA helicase [Alphaproteobacteria bacterium]|nr:ATP-dependent DNA helicase [Alphaproteobacteria bacterium]